MIDKSDHHIRAQFKSIRSLNLGKNTSHYALSVVQNPITIGLLDKFSTLRILDGFIFLVQNNYTHTIDGKSIKTTMTIKHCSQNKERRARLERYRYMNVHGVQVWCISHVMYHVILLWSNIGSNIPHVSISLSQYFIVPGKLDLNESICVLMLHASHLSP